MVKSLHDRLARSFVLNKELQLDPALRAAANDMSAAHLARIDRLLPAWLEEERRVQTATGQAFKSNELYMAVFARLLNELAFWHIEPGDPTYERATLAVLKTSSALAVCNIAGDSRNSDFSSRMLRVQAMPADERAAALATEQQLLARWGQPRAAAAAWPDPLPQDAAAALLKQQQADGKRRAFALPPILASSLLAEKKNYAAMYRSLQCAFQQWWLKESLRKGATPAAALNDFRYGTLISAAERLGMSAAPAADGKPESPPDKPAYPRIASAFFLTGVTTLRVQFDPAGKPRQASVADRKVEVPGIRGVRPIAFEDAFDAGAVSYAMGRPKFIKPDGTSPDSLRVVWHRGPIEEKSHDTRTGASQ